MIHPTRLLLVLLLCSVAFADDDGPVALKKADGRPAGWMDYESKEFGFRVVVPAKPKYSKQDIPTGGVITTAHAWQFMIAGELGLCQMQILDVGGDVPYDTETGLDGGCKGAVNGVNGEMLSYEKITVGGRSARAFTFKAATRGRNIQGRGLGLVLGPRRVAMAIAFWQAGSDTGRKGGNFYVESLRLPDRRPTGWVDYDNPEFGFKVAVPGQPKYLKQEIPAKGIVVTAHGWQFLMGGDLGLCQMQMMEAGGEAPYDTEKGLDGGCRGAVNGMKGEMLTYEKIEVGGRSARAFTFKAALGNRNVEGRGLGVVVAPRKFALAFSVWRAGNATGLANGNYFVESLELRAPRPEGWTDYESKEFKFRLAVPGEGKYQKRDIPTSGVITTAHFWQFKMADDTGLCQMQVMQVGGDVEYDSEKGLDGGCKGAVNGVNGEMLSYEKITVGGRSARAFTFKARMGADEIQGRGLGVIVGPRSVAMALAFWRAGKEKGPRWGNYFIESLKLLD